MPSIQESLAESSKRYALLAASAFVAREDAAFALAAGIAVEHALKARIATESPIFLASGRNIETWFKSARRLHAFSNDADAFNAVSSDVETLGAVQALIGALVIDPALKHLDPHIRRVVRFRNGQAHMGMVGDEDMKDVFVSCAIALKEILGLSDEFWGNHSQMVASLLDDAETEVRQRVEMNLSAARDEYDRRFGSEKAHIRSVVIAQIENARMWRFGEDVYLYECPACRNGALLEGSNRVEFEYSTHSDIPTAFVIFDATRLICDVCHLSLDGSDELLAADINPEIENENVDPGEVLGDMQPDEDVYRDR